MMIRPYGGAVNGGAGMMIRHCGGAANGGAACQSPKTPDAAT